MPDSSHLQQAELLADLGRYDEAIAELAEAEASESAGQTLLARIRLVRGEAQPALAAADAAVAAAPTALPGLIVRGLALAELGRVDEAAAQAEQILRSGRGNAYACTSAAAILATVRVGQVALDAAWEGVRLAPEQPRGHLVLGLVAARLGLPQVAARAYQEATTLDPQLPVATAESGLIRYEQQRYARALAALTGDRGGRGAAAPAGAAGLPPPPVDPVAEAGPPRLRPRLRRASGVALAGVLLVGWAQLTETLAPLVALLVAVALVALLSVGHRRLPEPLRVELVARLPIERSLLFTVWALLGVPLLLFCFALFAVPWLVAGAAVAAGAAMVLAGRAQPAHS